MMYRYQRKSTTLDAASTSFCQAILGPKYRRATWTCFFINMFAQFSGNNAINIFANRLLVRMSE